MPKKSIVKRLKTSSTAILVVLAVVIAASCTAQNPEPAQFDPQNDLLSLHYDHAPDKDDGQSAAADRTLLESLFDGEWIARHTVAVSGTYGLNKPDFNPASDPVMEAAFEDVGGWRSAHRDWDGTVAAVADRWQSVIDAGGDVWVKEGGQSDLTAAVVRYLREADPDFPAYEQVHVIQHSGWNEDYTTPEALEYVKSTTDYIRIADANSYLNIPGGDAAFEQAARAHPEFGPVWEAAFAYYDPAERLDFSDTGELLYLFDLDQLSIDEFRERFLAAE